MDIIFLIYIKRVYQYTLEKVPRNKDSRIRNPSIKESEIHSLDLTKDIL